MVTASPSPRINERLLLFTLAAVQFTHIMDFMIMMPLGSTLMRVFAIEPDQFSHLVAAYGLAAAVTGFAGGFVLDRFDRKHALLILYSGFALSTLACALAPNYQALLFARLAAGAFGGVSSSVIVAMVGDVIPPNRRGRAMGVVMSAFPIASVLGVPFGLLLAGTSNGTLRFSSWPRSVSSYSSPPHAPCLISGPNTRQPIRGRKWSPF